MLKLEDKDTIPLNGKNFEVWGDDLNDTTFYVLPSEPTIRVQDNKPVFQFLKYRSPIDQPDGPKGGLCVFDVELAITDDERQQIAEQLKQRKGKEQINFGSISFTRGEVRLNVEELSGGLVDSVVSPGKPSLYGNNVATFSVELSPLGASLFWNALGGPSEDLEDGEAAESGIITVYYDLWFSAMLPPASVAVTFKSEQIREFSRTQERNVWGSVTKEKIKDEWRQTQKGNIDVRFAPTWDDPDQEAEMKEQLREWGQRTMDEMVAQQLDVDLHVAEDRFSTGADQRESMISNTEDFERVYKESSAVEYNLLSQATLQNITSLIDAEGNRLVPAEEIKKYFRAIELEDPFFKQLRMGVNVSADYEDLKIFDILVDLTYDNKNMMNIDPEAIVKEGLRFSPENQGMQFVASYVEGDDQEVTYAYKVNFKGESEVYQSESKTLTGRFITIGVDDTGIFKVRGYSKGVDFDYVKSAQVSIRYEDSARGVRVPEKQFLLDKQNTEFNIVEPIFAPRDKPFEYKVLYRMQDDSEFTQGWQSHQANEFFLNDPFTKTKTYSIRGVGSFRNIDAIFLDLNYTGDEYGYRQIKKVTMDSQNRNVDWKVPVIDPAKGQMTYSGYIQYEDGNTEDIPLTTATSSTIKVGRIREGILEGTVNTDGIDFETRVRKVKVALIYGDKKKSFSFPDEGEEDWEFDQLDKDDAEYEWQAEILMKNRSFGDKGKIYLPGPTKDNWGTDDITEFALADYLPSDSELAEQSNLLLVQVLPKGIDWDEVEKTTVIVEYGNETERFRNWEEDDWEEKQKMLFLAPLAEQNGVVSTAYQWRAEFRTDDDERLYYPGPDKKAFAHSTDTVFYINDYIPEEYGGELAEG
ncbi:MAG: hypothetical protein AAF702_41875 [Chloroflexota bacterium]